MALLNSRVCRVIFLLLALAGALIGVLAGAGQQTKRARTPKSGDATPSEQEDARAASHAKIIRENNFGVALMNRQQFEQALGKFQRACILEPQSDIGCVNAGIAFLNMQRFDEARQILVKSAERDPRNPRVWFNLGLLEKAVDKPDAAIEDFTKVARLDSYDADTQYFIGLVYSQEHQYDKATVAFKHAIELNPFHVSAEFGLAQALQRNNDTPRSKEHFDRFQHLVSDKLGKPVSFIYGEQGKYSLAESMSPAPEPVPPAVSVHFANVTALSGLPARASAIGEEPGTLANATNRRRKAVTEESFPESVSHFLGSGACIIDYDGDGRPDIFLVDGDGKGNAALYKNEGGGRFVNVTKEAALEIHGEGMGCAVGDYDNDGKPDLAVSMNGGVFLFHNEGKGTFKDVTKEAGIEMDGLAMGVTFIDYDHDGDLDLYVTRFNDFPLTNPAEQFSFPMDAAPAGNVLWRNNGNRTFTNWTAEAGLAGTAPSIGAIGSDLNNDRAIDFVVTGWQKAPVAFMNPREGSFQATTPWSSDMPAPTAGVTALDFNKDGWMDLAFTHWGTPGLSLWRNVQGKSFERVVLPDFEWMRGWGVAALDYDDDGWLDLVAVGENFSGEGRIVLLRNEGEKGFRDLTSQTGLDKVVLHNPRGVIAFDFDGDGSTDFLITQNHLPPVLLKNEGGNRYNWLRLEFKGTNDNKTGIGTKVEMSAGALQQKWEIAGASGYLGQGGTDILAGLGPERSADVVRLLWPTGVLQDEVEIPALKTDRIAEIDRRGSSCPIVFAWNGKKFEFLADMIGPGIVGHWIAPNQRNTPDPEEYFKVAGSQVEAKDGVIQFRMVEPMEELDYLDQARLIAVDHPSDVEVYPNERFMTNPPFPKFKVIASFEAHPPLGAWDDRGHDLLPLLVERDRKYVTSFGDTPYAGFAAMHTIELDLGPWDPSRPLRLLMDGFTDYFSASSMYAAWQAGVQPVPPYVEMLDDSANWVRVVDDMGFPAGLSRTMVADLTGKLPPGTRFIRVSTNLKIYWDRIRVDNSPTDTPFKTMEVPLAKAQLQFLGYPRVVEGNPRNDLSYIYEDVSETGPYTRQTGNYTRYGDVTDLVRSPDDEYVIFGSGDEVAVDFDSTHLPDLPDGWTRDYLFYANGFAKDMDFYAAHGDTVSPLPFHTLVPYPYPKGVGYPEDERHLKYMLEYNTRGVAGPAGDSFRFEYPEKQP
ncbi:MAG TPA: FG-GAP-like repeat-containing protein [Candidatus Acidoferrales bacterium]|nr:FG-GAP-like repeat-containing protein [Candidatus Acidoferrales bacterium]